MVASRFAFKGGSYFVEENISYVSISNFMSHYLYYVPQYLMMITYKIQSECESRVNFSLSSQCHEGGEIS